MSMIITLKKDRKPICHIECLHPPADLYGLPRELSIDSFVSRGNISDISALPQFSVAPAPKCTRDKNEWGRFSTFMHKQDVVAIASFEQCKLYLLPPPKASISCSVNVAYQIGSPCTVDTRPRDCESGSHLAEEDGGHNTIMARGPPNGGDASSSLPKFPPAEDRAHHFTSETCGGIQSHAMKERLPERNFIRADPSYLKTLGQAHSGWIFGGIAELVDNSRDAKATKIDIFVDMIKLKKSGNDVPMLSVIDDGHGMNHDEIMRMVSFGHKKSDYDDKDQIGRFGVGFKAYKRVGGMIHSADVGRGVIGVMDVTNLIDDQDGHVWVHNNKQGFQDCEAYAGLEQWLGEKADEYWDTNFDSLSLDEDNCVYKPDCEWVQCDKCRKWRKLPSTFDSRALDTQWFCYMEPFKGQCADAEQKVKPGIVIVSTKRSGYDSTLKDISDATNTDGKLPNSENVKHPALKRLKRGPSHLQDMKNQNPRPNRKKDNHPS